MARRRAPFWARSIRRRPAAASVLAVLALVATVVSVLAPLLLRAAEQATLDDAVRGADPQAVSVAASAEVEIGTLSAAQGAVVATTAAAGDPDRWHDDVVVAETKAPVSRGDDGADAGERLPRIAGLSNDCRTAGLVAGRCPGGPDEVLVPSTSGTDVGTVLPLTVLDVPEQSFRVRVVGTYDPTSRVGRVVAGPNVRFGSGGDASPDYVMSLGGFDARALTGTMWSVRTLVSGLRLDDVPAVLADVDEAKDAALSADGAASSVSVREGVGELLGGVVAGNRSATLIVAVAALQAIVLAWAAQGVVAGRIGHARAAEWGLTRLRGLPARRRASAVLLEPVVATLVGAAAGAAVGLGIAALCAPVVLGPSAPPLEPFRAPVLLALAAAVVGSLVALVVASVRAARVDLVDLLRRATEPRRLSRTGAVLQAVAVAAAVVGLVALLTEPDVTGPGVALLAPSLVALLLGVVGLRAAVAAVRRRSRRPARSVTELLVVRRIARTPSQLTVAVVVVLGVALAVSSTQVAVLGVRLADDRAAASLGAATVLDVRVPAGRTLLAAVRAADPSGRQAMAVETASTGSGVGRLVALDTTRLGAVSSWDPAWGGRDLAELRRQLRPDTGPALRITGDRLAVTLADVGAPDGQAAGQVSTADPDDVDLVAVLQAADGWHQAVLGGPRDGMLTTGPGAVPCDDGCRLVWLGLANHATDGAPYGLAATVTGIAVGRGDSADRPVDRAWLVHDRWRNRIGADTLPSGGPTATVSDAREGLRVSFVDPSGSGTPSIAPRDAPEPLPALVGADTAVVPQPGVADGTVGFGLDGGPLLLGVVGTAPALPRVLADGAMVDLTTAGLVSDPAGTAVDHEVWVAPGAADRVRTALARQGVQVEQTRTLADAQRRAERAAPVLGALVGVPTAIAALVLTLLVVGGVGVVGARSRRRDVATLRTAGFHPSGLRLALFLEVAAPAAVAAVAGAVAGTAATLLTAAKLPLRDGSAPPMGTPVGAGTVAVVLLATVVVTAVVAAALTSSATRTPFAGGRS
ncbi:FtsX-like permease family protein [Curtobacterium sp. ER1/6]|uniref:FtsX-like permease family protein n=1 Tax=Curtobacterium sp. ER1/6 TaxID=1891920 RepID=UPI00084FB623|nr:FtsX-like permease family protein [Curtobacterium sp. ER1/6]OEI70248.1 hypothetical protein Cus16_0875 [Curtobacterium sp. ER1/6]